MTKELDINHDTKNGPNYDIWRTPLVNVAEFQSYSPIYKLRHLISFGVMAGSTHNTQPEAFTLNPNEMSISTFLDKKRVLPASDVNGRQACISIGWTLASIATASTYYHLRPHITLSEVNPKSVKPDKEFDKNVRYLEVAKIRFVDSQDGGIDLKYLQALQTRRVNRKTYDTGRPVPDEILTYLKNIKDNDVSLHLIMRGDPRITFLAELQAQADGYVANSNKFATELSDWLLPNDTTSCYGMPGDTFNIDDKSTLEIKAGLAELSKRNATDLGAFSRSSRKGIESAAFVGMLTSKADSPRTWIKSGTYLGNIANILEVRGISISIHAGLAEVALVRTGLSAMSLTKDKPVILFRAGYPKEGESLPPHSPRAKLDSFLIT